MGSLVLGLLSLVLMAPLGTPQDASPHSLSTLWYRGLIGSTATALENAARYEQNKEVELRLDFDGDRVTGRYFYIDTGRGRRGGNISLSGSRDARNAIRLEERGNAGGVTGVWAGVLEGDAFSGTWTDPTGRRTHRFFVRELANFDGEEREAAPGLAFRARRVIGTNLALPFLTQHPQSRVLERVNGRIKPCSRTHGAARRHRSPDGPTTSMSTGRSPTPQPSS